MKIHKIVKEVGDSGLPSLFIGASLVSSPSLFLGLLGLVNGELRRAEAVSYRFLNDHNIENLVKITEETQ